MKSSALKSHFYFPRHSSPTAPAQKLPHFFTITTNSYSKYTSESSPKSNKARNSSYPRPELKSSIEKYPSANPPILELASRKEESADIHQGSHSKFVLLGAVSLGFAMFLVGIDDQKALALGPDGPLMEEFWENVRRYGLYILTVSTGAIYTVLQPILELLRNPITAILIITILAGSFYIVSQVLGLMVGINEFSYDYGY